MPDGNLNLGPLVAGAGIALAVAVAGTPLAWRATRGAARWPRISVVSLACIGGVGLLSLAVLGIGEATALAMTFSAVMQVFVLPFLAFLPRKTAVPERG